MKLTEEPVNHCEAFPMGKRENVGKKNSIIFTYKWPESLMSVIYKKISQRTSNISQHQQREIIVIYNIVKYKELSDIVKY